MVLGAEGLHFASVIDEKINAFNSNQADAVTISAPERAFIKLWRHQTPEFLQLLEYHWQNFKVAESAVPLKIWAMPDLSPDTKVVRADRSKPLWQSIMKWSPKKNYYWLLRCIGTFVKNIKEQQVSGKKISLRASANKYRVNFKDASLHDQACVFAYFLPEWKAHLSNQQLQDILARFSKGYLQKELEEKVKTQDAELKATDFRFAQQASGSWSSVHGQTSASEKADQASEAREVAELNLTKLKLDSEVAQYVEHKRQLRSFRARLHEDKVAANLEYTQALDKATTEFAEKWLPCRKIAAAGVLTYVHELTTSWTESQGFQKAKVLQLYIASFDKLGHHWEPNQAPTLEVIANAIGSSPERTAALVMAPLVGCLGDGYDADAIRKAEDAMDKELREDQYGLHVTRVFIPFPEESIGNRKSNRPGGAACWFVVGRKRGTDKKLVSVFAQSFLCIRKRTMTECPVLPRSQWVNPCAPMARPLGAEHISKAARSKQWATGESLWRVVLRSSVEWLNLDRSWGLAVVDLHPYDGTLAKSVCNLYMAPEKLPFVMCVSPVWVKLGAINE